MKKSQRPPKKYITSFYNTISLIGAYIAAGSFGVIILLILMDALSPHGTPYLGILTWIIMPVFLAIGLLLIPLGMWREHVKRLHGKGTRTLPKLDLNEPSHRRSAFFFLAVTSVLALFTALGTYRAFEFSESVTFCGQVCHTVMEPEFVAYKSSPHARVKCVSCHVGEGAEWFVRSKLSGVRQVYSVLFKKYSRPIPTPITSLRPARETCEKCHWPEKFYDKKQTERVHYMPDENNTRWYYNMLIKVGGTDLVTEHSLGIHWHINNKVEYIATDDKRQVVPWVRITYKDGTSRVFTSEEETDGIDFDSMPKRVMDCMDCHNRPSHIFEAPQLVINKFLESGQIDRSLPMIKSTLVDLFEEIEELETTAAADSMIEQTVREFYAEEYPEISKTRADKIEQAVEVAKRIYSRNYFPAMKANWKAYPNDIGHLTSVGCYRCHDGTHTSDDGEVISNDCNLCHVLIEQGDGVTVKEQDLNGLEFKHPEDIDEEWRETGCYDCHGE